MVSAKFISLLSLPIGIDNINPIGKLPGQGKLIEHIGSTLPIRVFLNANILYLSYKLSLFATSFILGGKIGIVGIKIQS